MSEPKLPEGYSLKKVEFTYLRNEVGKIVLALPTEKCTPERIEETIKQVKGAEPTD